jgi:CelD/BcsL family acetyltransferase involved in cellulose biosynthesis
VLFISPLGDLVWLGSVAEQHRGWARADDLTVGPSCAPKLGKSPDTAKTPDFDRSVEHECAAVDTQSGVTPRVADPRSASDQGAPMLASEPPPCCPVPLDWPRRPWWFCSGRIDCPPKTPTSPDSTRGVNAAELGKTPRKMTGKHSVAIDRLGPKISSEHRWRPEQIRIIEVANLGCLWPRRTEWNALVDRSATNTIFQTLEWHASWWKTLAGSAQPFVLLVEAAGELVAVAPLMLSERRYLGRKRRILEFIGTGSSDYCDMIFDRTRPDALELVGKWLIDNSRNWDVISLRNVPSTSTTPQYLASIFNQGGYWTELQPSHMAPTRLLGDHATDRALLNKKSVRRHHNALLRDGNLEFKNCATTAEALDYLDVFFDQHIARRSLTEDRSQFLDPRQRMFYRELVQTLLSEGWAIFSVLLLNEAPIAFHFGFEYGGRLIWYTPSFDVAYSKQSPGEVLLNHLLMYAMERDLDEFDFSIGDEPYKYRYTNHNRRNVGIQVYRSPIPCCANRLWLYAKVRIKEQPRLACLARRARRSWRRISG